MDVEFVGAVGDVFGGLAAGPGGGVVGLGEGVDGCCEGAVVWEEAGGEAC